MTTIPPLNGQVIGMTHYATRALLERVLESLNLTFEQSVVLNVVASGDAPTVLAWEADSHACHAHDAVASAAHDGSAV